MLNNFNEIKCYYKNDYIKYNKSGKYSKIYICIFIIFNF